jgi:hypothetical protein
MFAAERFEGFARRTHTTPLDVLKALVDALTGVGLCGDIEETLIGFGVLQHRFGLAIDGKDQRPLRLLEMLHKLRWIPAKGRHCLNVFFDIEHGGLAQL